MAFCGVVDAMRHRRRRKREDGGEEPVRKHLIFSLGLEKERAYARRDGLISCLARPNNYQA